MRKLKVKDIAPAIKLVTALNVGDEIKKIASNNEDMTNAGVEIIGLILTKYSESPKLEKKLAEFLSGPFEMSVEDILDMDIDAFVDGIKEVGGISAFINFFGKSIA